MLPAYGVPVLSARCRSDVQAHLVVSTRLSTILLNIQASLISNNWSRGLDLPKSCSNDCNAASSALPKQSWNTDTMRRPSRHVRQNRFDSKGLTHTWNEALSPGNAYICHGLQMAKIVSIFLPGMRLGSSLTEPSDMCAGAFCVRVVPFDACKVKCFPHPERLLSALVRHSIGCDPQPGASLTRVTLGRAC